MFKHKIRKLAIFALAASVIISSNLSVPSSFAAENAEPASNGISEEIAKTVDFSIRTYNDSRKEDDQNIEVTLTFDKSISVKDGAESDVDVKIAGAELDAMPNTENGESNRTLSVKADSADPAKLIITIGSKKDSQFVKQTNASLEVQKSVSGVTHILTESTGKPVELRYIKCIIPNGLEIATTDSVTGSAVQPASVTKQIVHRSNVRSMVYIQLLKNGEPLLPTEKFDHNGSYVIHAHAFIDTVSGDTVLPELTEADYAELILQGYENNTKNLDSIASRYKMTVSDDTVTLSDTVAEENERLDINIFAWPNDDSLIADEPPADSDSNVYFNDVSGWEKEYVDYLAERGLIQGKSINEFCPADYITRAEFLKILAGISGENAEAYKGTSFSDVKETAWYAPYVEWAFRKGIVQGSDGEFDPDRKISRQDMAVIIQNFSQEQDVVIPKMESKISFADDNRIADYAKDAVYELQQAGVVTGDVNGKFLPQSSATRGQAAKIFAGYLQVSGK